VKLFAGPRFKETARALKQQPYGTHADEIETSLMLAIAPELVDMTMAEPMPFSPAGPARGPLSPDDPSAPNYAPSGSFGDPTLATPDKGSRVLTAILADMVEAAE
jgi:creatinine amidohydrolase